MKARILPLGDIAEFGKTDTVVLVLSLNPKEANDILRDMTETGDESPAAPRALYGILGTIAEGNRFGRAETMQETINTDGRTGVQVAEEHKESRRVNPLNIQINDGQGGTRGQFL